jgi:hypothetical protein
MWESENNKSEVRSQIEEVKAASWQLVRSEVMEAFEHSVTRNRELLERLAIGEEAL